MSEAQAHLLVADDDERIRGLLQKFLIRNGFLVTTARDAAQARRLLAGLEFDMLILDVMMPGEDGLSICRRLRAANDATPIIMLTAKVEDVDRIVGLEVGADDYLPKPFEPRELVARLQTVLRRHKSSGMAQTITLNSSTVMHFEGLDIDPARRNVTRAGEAIELTGTEFELLLVLAQEPGKVFSRDDIMNQLRGHEADLHTRAVDIVVSRLRKKLEPLDCIKTLRNAGYALALPRLPT